MPGSSNQISDQEHEELRLLYTVSVADIAFFKQQQWVVTNYTIAVYVAFVLAAKQLLTKPIGEWKLVVLCAFVIAAGVAAIALLGALQQSIQLRRKRLEGVRKRFSEAFAQAWRQAKTTDEIVFLQRAAAIFGALLSIWIIWWER